MNHSFNIDIATDYGVNIAIFLENIAFWTHKNIANEKHLHDDRYWIYNTVKAFARLFPYWTEKQVRLTIEKCISLGLLIAGNYNKSTYDQTRWYALTEAGLNLFPALKPREPTPPLICPKGQMEMPETANGIDQKGKPIPDINSDIITTTTTTKDNVPNQNTDSQSCEESSSFIISIKTDKEILEARKGNEDERTDEEFLKQCKHHLNNPNNKNNYTFEQRIVGLLRLIREKRFSPPAGYKSTKPVNKIDCPFTEDELNILATYKHAVRCGQPLTIYFNTAEKLEQASNIFEKDKKLGGK